MSMPMPITAPIEGAAEQAGRHCLQTLLNCYCREIANPEGQCRVGPFLGQHDWPAPARALLRHGLALQVRLPHTDGRLLAVVEQASATGNYRYLSPIYRCGEYSRWQELDWHQLAELLISELAGREGVPFNDELLTQIEDSVAVTQIILEVINPRREASEPLATFVASEQGMHWGHPFHPAPKSRLGFDGDALRRYSPETGAAFPLHYFAARPEVVMQRSLLDRDCASVVADAAPAGLAPDGFVLVPAHPWQAQCLLETPALQQAMRDDLVRTLGSAGPEFFATSSIRTLLAPGNPYFYKFSLHVRITNCLRKNAVYELDSALQVTALLRELLPSLQSRFPQLAVFEEPAFMGIDVDGIDAAARAQLLEGTALILREAFGSTLRPSAMPLLAGALFGDGDFGRDRLTRLLSVSGAAPTRERIEAWFATYVETLVFPILYCYFQHGIVFEPHLQNVVIGIERQWPTQVFLRDFEGVKLVREYWPAECLTLVAERARESLWYDAEQGWNRIAYCLFVNHLCEAIQHLAAFAPDLELRLWGVVADTLQRYQELHGNDASAVRINRVLAGEPFPMKGHLLNRFLKRSDKAAQYLGLFNPMAVATRGRP